MRNTLLVVLLTVTTTLPLAAQSGAKPNTVTPKEIADGWILLFDGDTTFGWTVDAGANIDGGVWHLGADKRVAAWTTSYFCTYELDFAYRLETKAGATVRHWLYRTGVPDTGLGFFPAEASGWHRCSIKTQAAADGSLTTFRKHYIPSGVDVHSSSSMQERRGDRPMKIGFQTDPGAKLLLRDIKLKPIGTKPLFNGKDLAGWKVFPGRKSQFTVEDGAITCKNGPGDLQTEGKYANFLLQLECKSNGKHLNSGIFFRCKPDDYQNGYEAQIHNNFTADPPKDYAVEEFDPKTHESTGKKKVKSAATDYGTGAIYRRVPARKDVAKDGEWFTMTIVAHSNHIATWVNGIQQVDWYDNRPANDNPRLGCRLEAGHISIQGHDPTTDLSFRNIRIAELP